MHNNLLYILTQAVIIWYNTITTAKLEFYTEKKVTVIAKCCEKCGVRHRNETLTCAICGTPFKDAAKKNFQRKMTVILTVVAVFVISLSTILIMRSIGPEALARDIMRSYKNNEPDALIETFPSFLTESENFDEKSYIKDMSKSVQRMSSYIFSYNSNKAVTPSEREQGELIQNFADFGGDRFDPSKLEEIKAVWVDFRGGETPGLWSTYHVRFVIIKYDGEWCWWPFD